MMLSWCIMIMEQALESEFILSIVREIRPVKISSSKKGQIYKSHMQVRFNTSTAISAMLLIFY